MVLIPTARDNQIRKWFDLVWNGPYLVWLSIMKFFPRYYIWVQTGKIGMLFYSENNVEKKKQIIFIYENYEALA